MKILILIFSLMLTAKAHSSCQREWNNLLCPGDFIVDDYGIPGHILEIDDSNLYVMGSRLGRTFTTKKFEVALGKGCLELYCVNDRVYMPNEQREGKILAINPYRRTLAIGDPSYYKIHIKSLYEVDLRLGCVLGKCVGDIIRSEYDIDQEVLYLNEYRKTVVVSNPFTGVLERKSLKNIFVVNPHPKFGDFERSHERFPEAVRGEMTFPFAEYSFTRPVLNNP